MWDESRLQLVKMFVVIVVVLAIITKGPLFLVSFPLKFISAIKISSPSQISPQPTVFQTKISFPTRSTSPIVFPTISQPTTQPKQLPTTILPLPTANPTTVIPSPTNPPIPTDPPANLSGDFTDDFSSTIIKNNWAVGNGITQNNRLIFSSPSRARLQSHSISGNFTATVDLVTAQSNSSNWMGTGMALITYTGGDYGAYQSGSGKRTGDVYLTYSGSSLTVYVNRLRDGNHEDWEKVGEASVSLGSRVQLRISRTGGIYTFSYNGNTLATVSDGPQGSGFVFLTANERDGNSSVRAEFDNFILDL